MKLQHESLKCAFIQIQNNPTTHMILLNFDKNPLYPIELNDYPKLFDYVLTKDGLVFFQNLRQKYNQGKSLELDEYNKLRLLYIYYATANRNPKKVSCWKELCLTLDLQGIQEKRMLNSKEDLIKKSLVTKNPMYESGLYRKHIEYVKKCK